MTQSPDQPTPAPLPTVRNRALRRQHLTFCSRECGAGCTVMAHDRATIEARELCDRLGRDWEPVVWENLGWHYKAELVNGDDFLAVYARTSGSEVRGDWQVRGYGATFNHKSWHDDPDPIKALAGVVDEINAEVARLNAVLSTVRGMVIPGSFLAEVAP
jgi:hypothetical protein